MDNVHPETAVRHEQKVRGNPTERRGSRKLLLFVLLGTGAVILIVYNTVELVRQNRMDSRFTPSRWVSLEEPERDSNDELSQQAAGRSSLRVAIAPVISPEKSLQVYQGLVDYLAAELDKEPVFLQGETYEQVNDLLRNRQCDIALVCTYAFVLGKEDFGTEALVVPLIGDEDHYHSYIVVPQSSLATSLLDLRGKRFGSANRLSNSGWLYPMVWLEEHGEDAETFFKGNHVIAGSHDRSVWQVASEHVDGAAVDSLVYDQMVDEDPTIAEKVRIIHTSPEFGMPPVVVPPGIDPDLKKKLLRILLNMNADARGKEILTSLRIDRFVRPRQGLFDSVRKNANYLESRR